MKHILVGLLMFFGSIASAQTKMTIPEIKTFVTKVVTDSRNIKTLQTDFTQTKSSKMLDKPIVSTGKMTMQMPNQLSWRYVTPTPLTVVFRDHQLYVNNNGVRKRFDAKSKMFEKINKLMVGSANGSMFTDPDFYVLYFKDSIGNTARFLPKNKQLAKYLKQLELYFPAGKATVSQMKMTDASGDITNISFRNTKINEVLPAGAFSY